jgi:hypothetical protein
MMIKETLAAAPSFDYVTGARAKVLLSVVTWRPVLAIALAMALAGCGSQNESATVEVFADQEWQPTGIQVEEGQRVEITFLSGQWSQCASGMASACAFAGAEGLGFESADDNVMSSGCQDEGLIARISGSDPYCAGASSSTLADHSGELALRMTDAVVGDNEGSVVVRVDVLRP